MAKIYTTDSFLNDILPGFETFKGFMGKLKNGTTKKFDTIIASDIEISFIEALLKIPVFLFILYLGFIISFALLVNTEPKNGYRIALVMSGSMEPEVLQGSAVFIEPVNTPKIGDVISFEELSTKTQKKTGRLIMHRIVAKSESGYLTKGDANNIPDANYVGNNEILGKVRFSVPYLGYVSHIILSWWGIILFVFIPGFLLARFQAKEIKVLRKLKT